MNNSNDSLVSYLTQELQDLIKLGPVHALTWVSSSDPGRWLQVSVHDGNEHYITALFVLPPRISKSVVDNALGKTGRRQNQTNHGTCLLYYLARTRNAEELLQSSSSAAQQCAEIMKVLWKVQSPEHFELLGARGPKIPLYGGNRPSLPAREGEAEPEKIQAAS